MSPAGKPLTSATDEKPALARETPVWNKFLLLLLFLELFANDKPQTILEIKESTLVISFVYDSGVFVFIINIF